jgi:hypothetical protein
MSTADSGLSLFGGLAVDPATNQAFVAIRKRHHSNRQSCPTVSTTLKAAQITEVQVPTVSGALIGGIAGSLMPQGTLTSPTPLSNVDIYGSGFDSSTQVRLDGTVIPSSGAFISSRHLKVTIPASFLAMPHRYALDVITGGGVHSNATDFFVIKAIDMKTACSGGNPDHSQFCGHRRSAAWTSLFLPLLWSATAAATTSQEIDINPRVRLSGASC